MKNDPNGGVEKVHEITATELEDSVRRTFRKLHLQMISDFGVMNPSIKEAAELVAVDMWFSGEIEGVNEPEDFDGDATAPWLMAALADTIAKLEARLTATNVLRHITRKLGAMFMLLG